MIQRLYEYIYAKRGLKDSYNGQIPYQTHSPSGLLRQHHGLDVEFKDHGHRDEKPSDKFNPFPV